MFNFVDATHLTIDGTNVHGSILAPYADAVGTNGAVNGTVAVDRWAGSMQLNHVPLLPFPQAGGGPTPL